MFLNLIDKTLFNIKYFYFSLLAIVVFSVLRVFPSGGGGGLWGHSMSSISPLITAVPPIKSKNSPPPSLLIMTKIFLDIFLIFA